MKYINFEKIYIQNFLSVGNPGITIVFQPGINLITGVNYDKDSRNGVGKSTVIESLYWCLFGDTMRDLKKDQIINNINKNSCIVSLEFSITTTEGCNKYSILREAKPSKVFLYENGVDITKSTIVKADNFINNLISSSGEIFQNAVIMTANNTVPFMAQKKGDKRKFIEDVLRLSIFGDMATRIKSDYADIRKTYEITFDQNQQHKNNLKLYELENKKQNINKEQKINDLNSRIIINNNEIDLTLKSLVEFNEKQYNDLDLKLKKYYPDILQEKKKISKIQLKAQHELEFEIKHKKQEIDKLKNMGDFCFVCKRKHTKDHLQHVNDQENSLLKDIDVLNKKNLSLVNIINETQNNINQLEEEFNKTKDYFHSLNIINSENNSKQKKIHQLELWNKQLNEDKEAIHNETSNFIDLINNTAKDIILTDNELERCQHKLKILDTSKFVVSEEGVKSYIVKKMLMLLNNRLNHYLTLLEAPCKCYFNEFFEEIVINDRGEECSYFNFSGGERKRIDIAILFMFQDIRRLQSDVKINLSMYDELFDSALDERGAECIVNILKERVHLNNESIYIVTHNKNTVKTGITNTVYLEKRNGFTKLL